MTHNTETIYINDLAFEAHAGGYTFMLDDSSGDKGPSPKMILLNALAACSGIDVVGMLNKMRVKFSDFRISVSGEQTEEHPKVYRSIHMVYHIKVTSTLDREKMEKAVQLSTEKYCGVHAMLAKAAEITHEVKYIKN